LKELENIFSKGLKDLNLNDDLSLFNVVSKHINIESDIILKALLNTLYTNADSGLDAKDISFKDFMNTVDGTKAIFPEKGMGNLVTRFSKYLKDYISLEKEVTGFYYDKNLKLNKIIFKDNTTGIENIIYAKKLINTMPIGVLNSLNESQHNLPKEFTKEISKIKMGSLNKIILEMKDKFFNELDVEDYTNIVIRSNKMNSQLIFLAKPSDNIIVSFVGGDKSIELQKKKSSAIDYALKFLKSAFDSNFIQDNLVSAKFTEWNNDRYSLGSYSSVEEGALEARQIYSTPIGSHLFFAGEAYLDE
jgi:monoamine oxidase